MRLATAVYSPPKAAGAVHLALLGVWLAGILLLAARPMLGRVKLHRLAAAAMREPRGLRLARVLARRFPVQGNIAMLFSPRCSIPFTFGILRPVILLPAGAAGWPAQRLRAALTHELAHVRRRDVLTQSAAYGVCLLFWFLPPVWLAYAALLREAETCCDQQVINRGVRGPVYAREIVDLVHESGGRVLLPTISSALGSRGMLKERVRQVLRLKPGRRPFGLRGALGVLALCAACALPILVLGAQTHPGAVGPEDPLFGTWSNTEYDQAGRYCNAKAVLTPDGRDLEYQHIADSQPVWECRNKFQETWVDAEGNHWYKIRWEGWLVPSGAGRKEGYWLARVSGGGTILEGVCAEYGYPPALSTQGPCYGILYKRQ
jgi:beta-lactamase regulating signal transducer with metallopeptidase domain